MYIYFDRFRYNSLFLITFARMKYAFRQIYFLFIAFNLILVLIGGSTFHNYRDCNNIEHLLDCSNMSKNQQESHSFVFENEIFLNNSTVKSIPIPAILILLSVSNFYFTSNYSCSIWQPPKLA
jgi:hypothetical protein